MNRKLIIATLLIVSFASLTYQIVWLRLLIKIFGSSVFAVSTLLASFMAGLALGSYIFGYYVDRHDRPTEFYGYLLASIGAIGFVTIYGFNPLYILTSFFFEKLSESFIFHELEFILAFLVMITPTTLIGGVFPVVNKILVEKEVGRDVGVVYSATNIAAGMGSIFSGFVFVSILGVKDTIVMISLIVALSGMVVIFSEREDLWRRA